MSVPSDQTGIGSNTDESEVLCIGDIEIENRVDRVSITGDVVLTKDKTGLALAGELRALLGEIVKTLEAGQPLPETGVLKPATNSAFTGCR